MASKAGSVVCLIPGLKAHKKEKSGIELVSSDLKLEAKELVTLS